MSKSSCYWLNRLLALLLGAFGVIAFSPLDFWPAAFISLSALLILIQKQSPKQAAVIGFWWGVGLFGCGLHWIYLCIEQFGGLPFIASWALIALLISYLSLYPALFTAALRWLLPESSLASLCLAAPAIWQITDWLRGTLLTGFPWLQFGYTQIDAPLAGLAPLGGVQLLTYGIVAGSGFMVWIGMKHRWSALVILPLVLLSLQPLRKISWTQEQPQHARHVALVQGNIAQALKWQPQNLTATLNHYWQLTQPLLPNTSLIVWPEMAIPDTDSSQMTFLRWLSQQLTAENQLITGISHHHPQGGYYNSLLVLSHTPPLSEQTPLAYYHKHHLVPFGEFVPLASLLRPLAPLFNLPMSSFSQGDYRQKPLKVGKWRLNPAICYEIILGEQLRANFTEEIDCLLTTSNDAWFGDSWGPWQHLQMARMRALELGRPLLRATNTGITVVTNAYGQIMAQLTPRISGVLQASVTPAKGITPYARWGNRPIWLLTTVSLLATWLLKRSQR
ncbi:MAG: apolipoprotein N-acyltransferase [Candidatus Symbiodolus clandestinus]